MSEKRKRYILPEEEIPHYWYNIQADMVNKPMPPLHPGTKQPLKAEHLYPIFAKELCHQVFALASCEKDPDMGKLDDNYLVYTNYDKKADFKVPTFYLAPQILVISDSKEPEYLEGEGAEQILAAYTDNMIARGYAAATNKESADLGIQVSYIASTYYFTSYTQPEWWWGYPGYWGPGYWGGNWGGGWYYPYAVTYSYSTNSFLTEMVNLKAEQGDSKKLPVVWTSYLTGFETGSKAINRTLAVEAVNQSFTQSPYLTNK